MGAGSQSRCNRLLPDLGFRDRSRHKGVHCVRDGYSLEMPARIAPITALVQAMQASVYAWSSIGSLLGGGGEFGRLLAAQGAIEFFQRPQARIGDVPVDELGKPRMANPRESRNLGPVAATRLKCCL